MLFGKTVRVVPVYSQDHLVFTNDAFCAGEGCWSVDATQCVETFARDQILQAQVVAYAENSVPYIRLYSVMQIPVSCD
jgi:hypothetical protein